METRSAGNGCLLITEAAFEWLGFGIAVNSCNFSAQIPSLKRDTGSNKESLGCGLFIHAELVDKPHIQGCFFGSGAMTHPETINLN